jgi:hypothetical protein
MLPFPKTHLQNNVISFQGCRMGVWPVHLHQQGCHALRLPCMPDQVPGPLCQCGCRYSGRDGKDDESGLSQADLRCCIGNSCACRRRGGDYLCQMQPLPGRHLLPPMGHLLWWRVRPCTPGGLPIWGAIVQALLLAWSIQWSTL